MNRQWKFVLLIACTFLAIVGFTVANFAPSPYGQWGASVALPYILSWMMFRVVDLYVPRLALPMLPYGAMFFFIAVIVMFFAPKTYAVIAFYILVPVFGITLLLWLVHIIISAAKDIVTSFNGQERG